MTQVELERMIVKDLPPLTTKEYNEIEEDLTHFIRERENTKNFMLLSNEIKYYTIFQKNNVFMTAGGAADKIMTFLTKDGFLRTLGKLKVLKRTETGEMEIWIGETFFLFFDADSFFVNI